MAKAKSGADRSISFNGFALNQRNQADAVMLFAEIPDRAAALVIMDPQYRAVLDKLKFGNEGKRQPERRALVQMNDDTIAFLIEEAWRTLKPSGHLALWTDKFGIATGNHHRWLRRVGFQVVDLIAWNKLRPGMGRRARCITEYLVIAQKSPQRAKGCWTDHSLNDCWLESSDRSAHPHAKPHVLTERLIRAMTKRGDLVVDPCAGSFGVLTACIASGRQFIGGDIAP